MTHFQFINIYLQIIKNRTYQSNIDIFDFDYEIRFILYRFVHLYGHWLSSISSGDSTALLFHPSTTE